MSNDEIVKGDSITTTDDGANEEKKLRDEFAASYPCFQPKLKLPCIVAGVVAFIVGAIIFSLIFVNLPCAKEIMAWEEGTPEPEKAVKSAVIAIVVGVVVILGVVVASVFIARAVAKKLQAKSYDDTKTRAFNDYKLCKQREQEQVKKAEEEQRKLDEILTCKFCGSKLYLFQNDGTVVDKSYLEKQYSVEVTGYNKAVVKPEYKKLEWKERVGQQIACGCNKCNYEITKSQNDYFANVSIGNGSILTAKSIKDTKAYNYVDMYKFSK